MKEQMKLDNENFAKLKEAKTGRGLLNTRKIKTGGFCCILGVFGILGFGVEGVLARTWTSKEGKTIDADIVAKTATTVDLKMTKGGKTVTLKLDRLSQADRDFIEKWTNPEQKKEDEKKDEKEDAFSDDKDTGMPKGEKGAKEEYFTAPWPKLISASAGEITEKKGDDGDFIYMSEHYEFICNAELSGAVVKRFATLFEATYQYVRALPLGNSKAHSTAGGKYKIYLFETKEQYFQAGGPQGSAGVFMSGKQIIMVPFESLGLIKGSSSWRVDYEKTNKTLPHEITHQLTDEEFFNAGSRGWYTEGLSEYVAVTPYRGGKFSVNSVDRAVKEFTTGFSRKDNRGRNIGTEITAPDLKSFMDMSYSDFAGAQGNFNYAFGALLVTYFCHYDGEEDAANLKNFLRAMKDGKGGDVAQKELLKGRSWDEMEEDIAKAWSKRGVKIDFK